MWQQNQRIDAQEALRHAKEGGPDTPRALFLRADLALAGQDREAAQHFFEEALAAGGEDFRARIALASFAGDAKDDAACEQHLLAAQKDFPGFDDRTLSAELRLAKFYEDHDRTDDAMAARERWLAWNAGDTETRLLVAAWHVDRAHADASGSVDSKELERAITLYGEVNEIDPFRRHVHRKWGDALRDAGRFDEALREYRMILAVPASLDIKGKQADLDDHQKAEVIGLQASCLLSLGKHDEALERAKAALALDPDCKVARETIEKLQ
jgi:tetratricopeptide (TPR) repeat protein